METHTKTTGGAPQRATIARREGACSVTRLHREHYSRLVDVARRHVDHRDQAEEVVQEAFTQFVARQCEPASGAEFAYLRTMVRNLAITRLRRRIVERSIIERGDVEPLGSSTYVSVEDEFVAAEDRAMLRKAVEALSPQQRLVTEQRHYLERSVDEIAEDLEVSSGTVKQHAFRARAALRTEFALAS